MVGAGPEWCAARWPPSRNADAEHAAKLSARRVRWCKYGIPQRGPSVFKGIKTQLDQLGGGLLSLCPVSLSLTHPHAQFW